MPTNEEKITAEIAEIQKLAKENKDIDANALIANIMARYQNTAEQLGAAQKTKSYLVSLLLPPFGIYYVIKFFIQGGTDARRVAWICLAITVLSILVTWSLSKTILSSFADTGIITPGQLQELVQ
ncbi:MAG: hypothetical protein Q8R08_01485 [bacterium]|nr:hypothetical protein [bacterium]